VASATEIDLSWNPSSDNVGVTGYQIRRDGTLIATSTTTTFLDAGLAASTTFSYTIAARDAAGNVSTNSTTVNATTPSAPPPPVAPPPLTGTALGNLANSMAPGTWAQLTAANQDAVLGVGNVSGTMIHFCNSMPWNPFSKVIEIIGMDHNWGMQRHVRYDVKTNQFILVAADDGLGTQVQHGYDHNTVNPFTGDLYHRFYSGFTGTISSFKKVLGGSSFVALPGVSASDQVAIGATWWSGPFVGGGSQGSFMIFNSGNALGNANDGQILAYNPLSNTWFFNKQAMAPFYGSGSTYHSVIEYSSIKNVAVYGGGNVAPNRLWRLNSDGSFIAMPNVPAGKGVGIQQGLLVNEPVSGNFLLLSAGELWELNPTGSGTWTQQTGARVPPGAVGVPGPSNPEAVIVSAIPDYGVVAFITQPGHTGATFFLYKHQ
jgi:chitodextrinase